MNAGHFITLVTLVLFVAILWWLSRKGDGPLDNSGAFDEEDETASIPNGPLLEWYQDSLEKLQGVRWHLNELLILVEQHNSAAKRGKFPTCAHITAPKARAFLDEVEAFFTGKKS